MTRARQVHPEGPIPGEAISLRATLQGDTTVWGCFVRYPDAGLAEFIAYQGWDFIVYDGEHGSIEPRDCEHLARAAELHGVATLVRVPTNSPATILRALDSGVTGCHVPMVTTVDNATDAVRAAKYHPLGDRGLGASRAAAYGQRGSLRDYVGRANDITTIVAHIETAAAVANLEAIASVDGVDVVFLGPTDLSQALGVPGQTDHPTVRAALDAAAAACGRTRCALGVMARDANDALEWQQKGASYIAVTFEAVVGASMRSFLKAVRG